MNYVYHVDCHELWGKGADSASVPFSIQLREASHRGIENAFVIYNPGHQSRPTVILPDLSSHLVIRILADKTMQATLIGPRTKAIFINRQKRVKTSIIRFQPHGLGLHIPLPVQELKDHSLSLSYFIGANRETEILGQMPEHASAVTIAKFMEALASSNRKKDSKSELLAAHFSNMQSAGLIQSVRNTARSLGVSERYLQRVTNQQIGLSPKTALRILRFRQSLIFRQNHPQASWSAIAQMAGYFDQSHMIDDYQQFLGQSPDRFFSQ